MANAKTTQWWMSEEMKKIIIFNALSMQMVLFMVKNCLFLFIDLLKRKIYYGNVVSFEVEILYGNRMKKRVKREWNLIS